MLSKLRNFSKTKLAGVLIGLIIIPFVFWGMGGMFSSGGKNNIAKINNKNISAQDFIDHIGSSRLNQKYIRDNLENNVIEDLASDLISQILIDMEIKDLNLSISEESLANRIKNNKNFLDEKKVFSRIKYEKFLLENNFSAPQFEMELKKRELKKKLFNYISGGTLTPYFMINKTYIDENKKVHIEYFPLDGLYKKEFSNDEISLFIKENKELLMKDYLDFSFVKLDTKTLIQSNEFNNEFFEKIDEIENLVSVGTNINEIKNKYNLNLISKINYIDENETNADIKEIYSKRNEEKIQLIDKDDYFLLYEIKKIKKVLPEISDKNFLEQVKNNLILKEKFELNQTLFQKIQKKEFKDKDFLELSNNKNNIKVSIIDSINDDSIFDESSIKLIYSFQKNNFLLISDKNRNIYMSKIKKIDAKNLLKSSDQFKEYSNKTNSKINDYLYRSYDHFLNSKYKVEINQNTLERVKNYFR